MQVTNISKLETSLNSEFARWNRRIVPFSSDFETNPHSTLFDCVTGEFGLNDTVGFAQLYKKHVQNEQPSDSLLCEIPFLFWGLADCLRLRCIVYKLGSDSITLYQNEDWTNTIEIGTVLNDNGSYSCYRLLPHLYPQVQKNGHVPQKMVIFFIFFFDKIG